MKIAINGKFLGQRLTGVQRYARELVIALDPLCHDLDVVLVVPEEGKNNCPKLNNIQTVIGGKRASTLWEQTTFARYVRRSHAVSVNLCNSAPLFARKIVCVHDMKLYAHPEFFSKKFRVWYRILFRNIMKKAEAILTVSDFSKREIGKYFPKAATRVHVVPNAWQHFGEGKRSDTVLQKYGLQRREYFFAMSSLEPNKNLKWIVNTAKNDPTALFAVAGGINRKVFSGVKEELPENVKLIGYVSDEEAKSLMEGCRAFTFVTFYEGFGLPPLEALSAGAPCVIVSDSEVMHEIFGDNAVYVSPDRYGENLRALAVPQGTNCLGKYSWKNSAAKLFEILKNM